MTEIKSIFKHIAFCLTTLTLLTIVVLSFSYAYAEGPADENGILDLSGCTAEEAMSVISNVNGDEILEVNLISADGKTQVDIDMLNKISAALPNAYIRCSFELFGKTVSSETECVEFDSVPIGNEGLANIREVLPYLTNCHYLLLADCGIDNELLAKLREDYPEKNVVWRIHIFNGSKSFLTDITLFRTVCVGDNDASQLKYCNKVKYIDVGHQKNLTDISFVEGMPDLEVLILVDTGVTDISYLKNCKNLEYLELFVTKIADLSPLAELENLQHLNIANMPNVTDITPLYGLHNLKRLRIDTEKDLEKYRIPREQLDTITRLLPDCDMQFGIGCCNSNGWRYNCLNQWTERYILLREQMRYDDF